MIMKKKIRFMIFNEAYWNKGLIFSQNILPLMKLKQKNENYIIQIFAFCSILDLYLYKSKIRSFSKDLNSEGISVINFPIFFIRSRYFALRWYIIPFFILSIFPYIIYLIIKDYFKSEDNVFYHLRSYPISFAFSLLYKGKAKLIFDPRSDFNAENKKIHLWENNSITDKMWNNYERQILLKSYKSIFISESQRKETLTRHGINIAENKFILFFNTIDFQYFEETFNVNKEIYDINFLYTGSLGNWNDLNTYLVFFQRIRPFFPKSILHIVSSTKKRKLETIIENPRYKEIIPYLNIQYNIPYDKLPHVYKGNSVGLQLMSQADNRVGVKFIEYLAAGLTPIVNQNVKGAVEFCEKGLGIVVNEDMDYKKIAEQIIQMRSDIINRIKNYNMAKSFFDINETYINLEKIYK